jgi:3-oxoacyl-[acyl-carrier protein] reductase
MTQTVLITGGARGIGKAIAEAFVANGDTVFITTRGAAQVPGCITISADLAEPGAIDHIFKTIEASSHSLDILVANAGISKEQLLVRTEDSEISDLVDINLISNIKLCRNAAKVLMRKRAGSIVLVGSVLGMSGSAGSSVYAATKSALIGLVRSLAREIGPRNVTVNLVTPGYVNTEMTADLPDNFKEQVIANTPLNRIAEPAEIAGLVLFLTSEQARFITGAIIPVDGGLGMGN